MGPPALLVAGSIALDTLEGPWGTVEGELGGSALYFALAASLVMPVALVAPVGAADEPRVRAVLAGRPIDLSGLSVLEAPTYRWHARQAGGRNLDLGSRDAIYDAWRPVVPEDFGGWAFVGSMRSRLQVEIAERLAAASLLAGDAMRAYLLDAPAQANRLLAACDWFFANRQELAAMGGDPAQPDRFRRRHRLSGLCVKAGASGVTVHTAQGAISLPALSSRPVRDTTGAGDAMAGGTLARWLSLGGGPEALAAGLRFGVACAALAIEELGVAGIARATGAEALALSEEVRSNRGPP